MTSRKSDLGAKVGSNDIEIYVQVAIFSMVIFIPAERLKTY